MSAAEAARPISAVEAKRLFHPLAQACALVLAVSGGPDSTALLVLAARWRGTRKKAPKLLAVTIDHGLRPQSAHEARSVQRLARSLGVPHRILRWEGRKPRTGVQEAARAARYRLLAAVARTAKADHILTAHTLDDQAETVLIRMSRGSGITGLGAMKEVTPLPVARSARRSPDEAKRNPGRCSRIAPSRVEDARERAYGSMRATPGEQLLLVRPLLEIPKARLIATLERAGIEYADDISNRDPRFARARWRDVMPALAREGLDAPRIALFTRRLQRAEIALESAVDVAATDVSEGAWGDSWGNSWENAGPIVLDAEKFLRLPAEIALRLLGRAIAHAGDEGSPRLGKLETLYGALYGALYDALAAAKAADCVRLRRTLAGALVTLTQRRLMIERAPPRSHRGAPP